jgi:hypothetical protein
MLFSNKDVIQDWVGVAFDSLSLKTVLEFSDVDEKNNNIGISNCIICLQNIYYLFVQQPVS